MTFISGEFLAVNINFLYKIDNGGSYYYMQLMSLFGRMESLWPGVTAAIGRKPQVKYLENRLEKEEVALVLARLKVWPAYCTGFVPVYFLTFLLCLLKVHFVNVLMAQYLSSDAHLTVSIYIVCPPIDISYIIIHV